MIVEHCDICKKRCEEDHKRFCEFIPIIIENKSIRCGHHVGNQNEKDYADFYIRIECGDLVRDLDNEEDEISICKSCGKKIRRIIIEELSKK